MNRLIFVLWFSIVGCGRLRFEPIVEESAPDAAGRGPGLADASLDANAVDASVDASAISAEDAAADAMEIVRCPPGLTGPRCSECVRYVDRANTNTVRDGLTWQTAIDDIIQGEVAASNAANLLGLNGVCQLWVRSGRYYVYVDHPVNTIPLAANVLLYGGFAGDELALAQRDLRTHPTILDGRDPSGSMHVFHPLTSTAGGSIDGFVVVGGLANGSAVHANGGGMQITSGTVHLTNMTFRDNATTGLGGALYVANAVALIENSSFEDNQADGSGGAIAVEGASGLLSLHAVDLRNNVSGGEGGGLYASPTVAGARVELQNVVFTQNVAGGRAGGVLLRNVRCAIAACTLAANQAGSGAGSIDVAGSSDCTLLNTVSWNPGTAFELSGLTTIRHSLVRGGAAGVGNLASDPAFASYPNDSRLTALSPAVDAADGCAGPELDREGQARRDNLAVSNAVPGSASDMGAYELQVGVPHSDALCR